MEELEAIAFGLSCAQHPVPKEEQHLLLEDRTTLEAGVEAGVCSEVGLQERGRSFTSLK